MPTTAVDLWLMAPRSVEVQLVGAGPTQAAPAFGGAVLLAVPSAVPSGEREGALAAVLIASLVGADSPAAAGALTVAVVQTQRQLAGAPSTTDAGLLALGPLTARMAPTDLPAGRGGDLRPALVAGTLAGADTTTSAGTLRLVAQAQLVGAPSSTAAGMLGGVVGYQLGAAAASTAAAGAPRVGLVVRPAGAPTTAATGGYSVQLVTRAVRGATPSQAVGTIRYRVSGAHGGASITARRGWIMQRPDTVRLTQAPAGRITR